MDHSGLSRYIGSAALIMVVLCLLSASFAYAETIYVHSEATGSNNGTSWGNAYVDLQIAIDAAVSGDEIWVAAGTYYPTSWPNGGFEDRERHFSLKYGVAVYGGFAGTETSLSQRDVETNETILSGDIGIEGDRSDNCYHVFFHPEGTNLDTSAILDGFTIKGGNANGSSSHGSGGSMYNLESSPTLINCTFSGNLADDGGGMYNRDSSPTLTNCTFSGNLACSDGDGGGMHNDLSSPELVNCTFRGNWARYGGGIYNNHSSPELINCFFIDNSVEFSYIEPLPGWLWGVPWPVTYEGSGGGMFNRSSSPNLTNCTFSGNWAYYSGGGIHNESSSPKLTNCILWNNDSGDSGNEVYNYGSMPTFAYCDIQSSFDEGVWDEGLGTDGGNNIDSDPLFVRNPGTNGEDDPGDLHLTPDSPCIDAGDPSVTDGEDMDGEVRVFDGDGDGTAIVDIGADEYVDSDYDGVDDNSDLCPEDFAKTDPGICGCGIPDMDTDEDGIIDCVELPDIITTTMSRNTGEDGTSATFDVRLDSPPNGDVILFIESTDDSEGTVSPGTLTFTSFTWSIDQTVTVTGVDDDNVDGDQTYYVQVIVDSDNTQDTTGYLDLDEVDISVTNSDDGNDGGGSNGDGGSDGGNGGTGGSNGGGVSSKGGSSGGCFINSLSDVEE